MPVDAPTHVRTTRLDLRPADPDDTEALFPIFSDPAGWWYEPASRHLGVDSTRRFLVRAHDRWALHGLSYWTVRLADEQTVIGLGGTQRHRSGSWNLSYRIAGTQQGRGYARELAAAGEHATAEKGESLFAAIAQDVATYIDDYSTWPLREMIGPARP